MFPSFIPEDPSVSSPGWQRLTLETFLLLSVVRQAPGKCVCKPWRQIAWARPCKYTLSYFRRDMEPSHTISALK